MWILTAFYELFGEILLNRLIKIIPLFKRLIPELYRVAHRYEPRSTSIKGCFARILTRSASS